MVNSWLPQFKHSDFEILSETTPYTGYCAIKQYTLRYRLFRDGWSEPVTRDLMCRESRDATAVLLYDPDQDKVVMIEQIRMGALQDQLSPWLLEIVAGVIDPGETPESTAFKEAKEEANCDIYSLRHICNYYPSPGISAEMTHLYCGFVRVADAYGICDKKEANTHPLSLVHGLIEDGEDIKCHMLSTDEALNLLNRGIISSASAVIALQWLALNRASFSEI